MNECRTLFCKKLHDYGASWRILRPSSLTDQFHQSQANPFFGNQERVAGGRGIRPEFIALINYGIVGLIQLEKDLWTEVDMTPDEAMVFYDKHADEALSLMLKRITTMMSLALDAREQSYGFSF